MSRPTDIRVVAVEFAVEHLPYRAPLKFGGRIIAESEIVNAKITVENRSGATAIGFGSMPLGNVWAWPSKQVEPAAAAVAMKDLAGAVAQWLDADCHIPAHPLDHGHALSGQRLALADGAAKRLNLPEAIPPLAVLVAASPFDAALHDGFAKAAGINAYNGLGPDFVSHDLRHYLGDDRFVDEFLDAYTLREPKPRMPLYHLVGALDPLSHGDVGKPIGDGLPETLDEWIPFNGLTHLKIKLNGDDLSWDVERVLSVDRIATAAQAKRGCEHWLYSLDFNEKCAGASYVVEFLRRIEAAVPAAYSRVQYIEQPTHRDLKTHRNQRMHEVAKLKPVVIDESLVDYESLLLAREMGYTGVALKACKGHTDALLMAAAAQRFEMFLCVQDLTCPGASFLHSAGIAARIPTIVAIEGNGRQYCPAGNDGWNDRFPKMFDISDGTVETGCLTAPGLGHT